MRWTSLKCRTSASSTGSYAVTWTRCASALRVYVEVIPATSSSAVFCVRLGLVTIVNLGSLSAAPVVSENSTVLSHPDLRRRASGSRQHPAASPARTTQEVFKLQPEERAVELDRPVTRHASRARPGCAAVNAGPCPNACSDLPPAQTRGHRALPGDAGAPLDVSRHGECQGRSGALRQLTTAARAQGARRVSGLRDPGAGLLSALLPGLPSKHAGREQLQESSGLSFV